MGRTKLIEDIKKSARKPVEKADPNLRGFFSTGSTLLNLALCDKPYGGFPKGKIINIVGDSHTGKTILALTLLAEIANSDKEDLEDYRLIYDDAEAANSFNMQYLFGSATDERIEAPAYDEDEEPIYSETVEHLQAYVHQTVQGGRPFIYVLDSLDSISSMDEMERVETEAKAITEGKVPKGSYKMEKAKKMSELFRTLTKKISSAESLLAIISQTRDNIDPMSFQKKKRSGGQALEFYCTHVIWLASKGPIKSRERIIGANVIARVSKNKTTGKRRNVEFSIYYDYGIDDIGSMIDWMVKEKFWTKTKQSIRCPGISSSPLSRAKLIEYIEDKNLERKLRRLVANKWTEIEESLKLRRKRRYE